MVAMFELQNNNIYLHVNRIIFLKESCALFFASLNMAAVKKVGGSAFSLLFITEQVANHISCICDRMLADLYQNINKHTCIHNNLCIYKGEDAEMCALNKTTDFFCSNEIFN